MNRFSVYFVKPGEIELRQEELPSLPAGQVLVQTILSAISPGTELLIYRGQFPAGLSVDESISSFKNQFAYPLKYGYAVVGKIIAVGGGLDSDWENRIVFAFHPHESHFHASPDELIPLPEGFPIEDAAFLPNMETAINLVMDGRPLIGEQVAVFGQGIVGLLTAALLSQFPLGSLVTLDRYALRRQASLQVGASASLDPGEPQTLDQLERLLPGGADLTFELTGSPTALDQAIRVTGFAGRVIIGSWYGQKQANLDLGGKFHRSRIRLISSQVSTIDPELTGRWDKQRRFEVAWEMLRRIKPSRFITHRFPIQQAPQAYHLLDKNPDQAIQVVLEY